MADTQNIPYGECLSLLRRNYDGYHFFQNSEGVYNSFSLLKALKGKSFGSYWFETGTPTFLVKKVKSAVIDIRDITNKTLYATDEYLSNYRGDDDDPVPMLYQTGYLSISGYDARRRRYTLGFPNEEVKYGFLNCLLPEYVKDTGAGTGKDIFSIDDYVENGEPDKLRDAFTALFASIPW